MKKRFSTKMAMNHPRLSAASSGWLLPLAGLILVLSALTGQSAGISLKAVPNQTTSFQASAFQSSTTSTNAGIGLTNVYTGMNGTVTLCDGNVLYTPASGFTGSDSFNVTVTNSAGSVSSTLVTVTVQPVPTLILQPGNLVQVQLLGTPDTAYNIQASTNFVTWTTIGSAIADTNGMILFTDTNTMSYSFRYYRISAQ